MIGWRRVMINGMTELHQEFLKRARSINLKVDCAMDGTFNSQVAIVGEAPGPREVQLKVPLVGGSGGLLWSTLKKHQMHRSEFYITNVVKRQLALSGLEAVSYTHLRAHETPEHLVCRLLL